MCGIVAVAGHRWDSELLERMVGAQRHRGPDATGLFRDPSGIGGLGHNRLSIIDLSASGRNPMASHDGRYWIVFNGEVYNYLELRRELSDYPFRSQTDTEVVLAAYTRWGDECLSRFIGMFALCIWDTQTRSALRRARPLWRQASATTTRAADGTLLVASEIKALHAAGVPAAPDEKTWATYLASACPTT